MQVEVSPREGGAPWAPCSSEQARRLGKALQLRTVTILSEQASSHPSYPEFLAFEDLLRREFPLAARALSWERIGDLALLGTWRPDGSPAAPPAHVGAGEAILLYAHYDVVPAGDESAWTHPPFGGEVDQGFVWGRGALDLKGSLMGIMEAVESLLGSGFHPDRTIYVGFGGDEETLGTRGAKEIARALAARGERLRCVLDEGSIISDGMLSFMPRPVAMIGLAEKGFVNVRLAVRGKPGHASMPGRGTTAAALAGAINALERAPFPSRMTGTVDRFFGALAPYARFPVGLALRLRRPLWPLLRRMLALNPATDALFHTTMAVTVLRSGETPNVLPAEAQAVINLRLLPGETARDALARIQRIVRKAVRSELEVAVDFLPGNEPCEPVPESRLDEPLWRAVRDSVRDIAPQAIVAPFMVIMATDSRRFVPVADSLLRFLPLSLGTGEVSRIHGVDERISLENYGRMIAFYQAMMRRLARHAA